jgi:hypothetical protein
MFKVFVFASLLIASMTGSEAACSGSDRSQYELRGETSIYTSVSLCFANNLDNTQVATNCISKALGVRDECSSCFVESAKCSVKNCLDYCIDGKDGTPSCKVCFKLKCLPTFSKCAFNSGDDN